MRIFSITGRSGMAAMILSSPPEDPKVQEALDKFYMPSIYMSTADYTAYAERTFKAEKATIERLGLAKKA
ncbi:MAG: hypothetical protein MUF33_14900 [Candidatus Nanopelagicales bacterium]|nr:hypothetical protein [Candidatus Nanopelagicales bacterium]MCU0299785.1 hypothetical protein [Candidatus Nanopelagicales bacterium]